MTVEIEIDGRRRTVELMRETGSAPPSWRATIDGRVMRVDVARAGDHLSLLIDGRSWTVAVDLVGGGSSGRRPVSVAVDGAVVAATVIDPRGARFGSKVTAAAGVLAVKAPMPGRIVKVLVRPGEAVSARQGLVVVEAMKMENELRAATEGVVRDVLVSEGASVEAGAVLVVLD